jgi:hypothetical protein
MRRGEARCAGRRGAHRGLPAPTTLLFAPLNFRQKIARSRAKYARHVAGGWTEGALVNVF